MQLILPSFSDSNLSIDCISQPLIFSRCYILLLDLKISVACNEFDTRGVGKLPYLVTLWLTVFDAQHPFRACTLATDGGIFHKTYIAQISIQNMQWLVGKFQQLLVPAKIIWSTSYWSPPSYWSPSYFMYSCASHVAEMIDSLFQKFWVWGKVCNRLRLSFQRTASY